MNTDIILPKNNEKDFLALAKKLGYGGLCFVYAQKDFSDKILGNKLNAKLKKLRQEAKKFGMEIFVGVFGDEKQKMNFPHGNHFLDIDFKLVRASFDTRNIFERNDIDAVFGLEAFEKMDFSHSRNSGLNHVLCNLAKNNNIAIAFSLSSLLNSKNSIRSQIKGRMSQNIRLCRKYDVETVIASFASKPEEMRSEHDLKSLFLVLGMSGKQVNSSSEALFKIISENSKRKSGRFLAKGIEQF